MLLQVKFVFLFFLGHFCLCVKPFLRAFLQYGCSVRKCCHVNLEKSFVQCLFIMIDFRVRFIVILVSSKRFPLTIQFYIRKQGLLIVFLFFLFFLSDLILPLPIIGSVFLVDGLQRFIPLDGNVMLVVEIFRVFLFTLRVGHYVLSLLFIGLTFGRFNLLLISLACCRLHFIFMLLGSCFGFLSGSFCCFCCFSCLFRFNIRFVRARS